MNRNTVKVAAIQMHSSANKEDNLAKAREFINEAGSAGARIICLPEMFNFIGFPKDALQQAEDLNGITLNCLKELAVRNEAYIVAGSIFEKSSNPSKVHNTSVIVNPLGSIVGVYRKVHLFNVDLPTVTYKESEIVEPGDADCVVRTEFCTVGLAVCFDLRFPELFRREALKGAEVIVVPSAFTMFTGKDHWFTLTRARAIENQVYIVAPEQIGSSPSGIAWYGRSVIVDPWGVVVACAEDDEGVIVAELDLDRQKKIRSELPTLPHVKFKILNNP